MESISHLAESSSLLVEFSSHLVNLAVNFNHLAQKTLKKLPKTCKIPKKNPQNNNEINRQFMS
jgi:hypothetical protein